MDVNIYPDYNKMSAETADLMIRLLLQKPSAAFVLASGNTPIKAYELFVEEIVSRNIDCTQMTIVGLDEWVGVNKEDPGSCFAFFQKNIMSKLPLKAGQFHFFDGMAIDLNAECKRMDKIIQSKQGIDMMVVGIGMNGHIGFNEPDTPVDLYSHVIQLQETTKVNGKKYFTSEVNLDRGITLGLKYLLESRQVLLLANGQHKAKIISEVMHFPITPGLPASLLKQHPNAALMLDKEAAILL